MPWRLSDRAGPGRSRRTALLVSLGLHAALALSAAALLGGGPRPATPSPAVDVVCIVPETRLHLGPSPGDSRPSGSPAKEPAREPSPTIAIPLSVSNDEPTRAARAVPGLGSEPAAGGLGAGPGPGAGAVTFFRVPAQGQSVVYVMDRSLSMGPSGALDVAKYELLTSLAELPATARFQIIAYNRSAEPLRLGGRSGLVAATAEAKHAADRLVRPLRPEGATDHVQALRRALELQPDLIFLVTDAADLTAEQIAALTRQNHGRSAIHVVELAEGRRPGAEGPLRRLAHGNRGTYQARDVRP